MNTIFKMSAIIASAMFSTLTTMLVSNKATTCLIVITLLTQGQPLLHPQTKVLQRVVSELNTHGANLTECWLCIHRQRVLHHPHLYERVSSLGWIYQKGKEPSSPQGGVTKTNVTGSEREFIRWHRNPKVFQHLPAQHTNKALSVPPPQVVLVQKTPYLLCIASKKGYRKHTVNIGEIPHYLCKSYIDVDLTDLSVYVAWNHQGSTTRYNDRKIWWAPPIKNWNMVPNFRGWETEEYHSCIIKEYCIFSWDGGKIMHQYGTMSVSTPLSLVLQTVICSHGLWSELPQEVKWDRWHQSGYDNLTRIQMFCARFNPKIYKKRTHLGSPFWKDVTRQKVEKESKDFLSLAAPQGYFFDCGTKLLKVLPSHWEGVCAVVTAVPDLELRTDLHSNNLTNMGSFVHRNKRSENPLVVRSSGFHSFIRALLPWVGVAELEKAIINISAEVELSFNHTAHAILNLQTKIDSLAHQVQLHKIGLNTLLAEQGGLCALVHEKCCFYVNKSAQIEQNVNNIKDAIKVFHETATAHSNGFWEWLTSWFPNVGALKYIIITILGVAVIIVLGCFILPCFWPLLRKLIYSAVESKTERKVNSHLLSMWAIPTTDACVGTDDAELSRYG